MLTNKKILLCITGGIAAYKCTFLVRLLVKEGAEVKVLMTNAALDFVTPRSLAVLSKNEVLTDFFDANHNWNNHVKLAEWADVLLVAPLTANTLAKMAAGICDNLLLATYFSAKSKTIVAPAMDLDMYRHPTVIANLNTLKAFGNLVIPAESGELASGLHGEGRMAEPETIRDYLRNYFSPQLPLKGKKALVNAGPTHEPLDPVRYIGNRSSGRMGLEIAKSLHNAGADVLLVMGPAGIKLEGLPFKVISVETGDEMYDACVNVFADVDIAVCSAAVADYKPATRSTVKIKKKEEHLRLDLVKARDILQKLGEIKTVQCLVGFALESENLETYALEKLKKKNLDLIVANPANETGVGMGSDLNRITIFDRHNKSAKFELQSKHQAAEHIVQYIIKFFQIRNEI